MNFVSRYTNKPKHLFYLFCALAVFAGLQAYFGPLKTFQEGGKLYTTFNNYIIFKQSFFHLIEGKDLYKHFHAEYWDLYKYSPAFALFFGLLAYLPDLAGLSLWAILNALVLFFSIYFLPKTDIRTKGLILLFCVLELLTSLQSEQSNALIAGLLIFTFGFLEKRNYWMASFCLVTTIFIKLFGIVGLALYLLYPDKLKLTYTTAFWIILFTFIPLLVVDFQQFIFLYKSWGNLLANDHTISDGLSVMGWLKTWFGWNVNKTIVSIIGAVVFCLPLLRIKKYTDFNFRLLLLSSVLIWVIIFNHRAESPTFVIAISGVALWYFSQVPKTENLILLILAFVFTVLAHTDVFPKFIKHDYFYPYVVKAVPCIFIWVKISFDLLFGDLKPPLQENAP